jgi:RimJ/RimL family protein N-acetyltransferase
MDALTAAWPLFGLRLRTGDVELRLPTDPELAALADLAAEGIHPAGTMPFGVPWTRAQPPWFQRRFLQHHWSMRGSWSPDEWHLNLGTYAGGEPVGAQSIAAQGFALRRVVSTGSWLGQRHQGHGIGTAMRIAVLGLAFDGLGALDAETAAWEDNLASQGVTRKLGYRPNGDEHLDREGVRARHLRFTMTADQWRAQPRPEISITGLDACRELFGA